MKQQLRILLALLACSFLLWPLQQLSLADNTDNPRHRFPQAQTQIEPSALGPSVAFVNDRQLMVQKRKPDGSLDQSIPFVIRGVNWSPASVGTLDTISSRRNEFGMWVSVDSSLLAGMSVNTVQLYLDPPLDASGLSVLDQLYNNGIMVVMTVDEGINNLSRVQQAVNFYKNHPAILGWMLGNEWNINLYHNVASSVQDAANRTETAAHLVKSLDPNHAVITSYGDIDINDLGKHLSDTQGYVNVTCPSVDIWSLNIFRGNTFGNLFDQWSSITTKPMLMGEFGTDGFRSFNTNNPPQGVVDQAMQTDWDVSEWNQLFINLSGRNPNKVAIGGFVFEWNDEWWKVPNSAGVQNTNGCGPPNCSGHPDSFSNEEYFGIVDINRNPRQAYNLLKVAFDPSYLPQTMSFRATSRGATATEDPFQQGVARLYRAGALFYQATGGAGGGRGFNVAAFDPSTLLIRGTARNFDTFSDRDAANGSHQALIQYLDSQPNGTLIMLSIADEGGIDNFPPNDCSILGVAGNQSLLNKLESLGSHKIRNYCYRDSWAMITVKGEATARDENLSRTQEVSAQTTLTLGARGLTVNKMWLGNGIVTSNIAGINCGNSCNSNYAFGTTVTLTATASSGSVFTGWGGACSGTGSCTVTLDSASVVSASFDTLLTLTVTKAGTGSGTITSNIGGINCGTNCSTQFSSVTQIMLTASPAVGSAFVRWSGDCNSALPVCSLTVDGNKSATAIFARTSGDYDGDGKTDFTVWRASTGTWFVLNSSNGQSQTRQWGSQVLGDIPVSGDFDGDGKTDFAVWRASTGTWYVINSSTGQTQVRQWGSQALGDVPVPGDYDGDGKTDFAVWRASTGTWYVINSSTGQTQVRQWGSQSLGDVPVPGDYDGDGRTDFAVWRASTGTWYVINSSTGQTQMRQWGSQSLGDIPVASDYDGDGKTDFAVWRASTGTWFVINSGNGQTQIRQWGNQSLGDVPKAGDYDGDAKADFSVWRASTGTWYVINSSNGQTQIRQWGDQSLGDIPIR